MKKQIAEESCLTKLNQQGWIKERMNMINEGDRSEAMCRNKYNIVLLFHSEGEEGILHSVKHDEGKLELKPISFPSSSQHHAKIVIILNPPKKSFYTQIYQISKTYQTHIELVEHKQTYTF